MGMKLYEIAAEYRATAEVLSNLDIDAQTVKDTIAEVEGDLVDKLVAVVQVAKSLAAEGKAVADVAKSQAGRAKALIGRSDDLMDYALHNMQTAGLPEVKQPDISIKLRDNPGAAKCVDEALTPELYVEEATVRSIDRAGILTALRNGVAVPGWSLEKGQRLEVK